MSTITADQITDLTTEDTVFYSIGVKGKRNRKVFRADSASCGDKGFVLYLATLLAQQNPEVAVYLVDAKADHAYRGNRVPLAGDEAYADIDDDGDVNLDELSDDQL